jgi:urease accessory protein
MPEHKNRVSLLTLAATKENARPHPGPLPRGEGGLIGASAGGSSAGLGLDSPPMNRGDGDCTDANKESSSYTTILPLLGERAGVGAGVSSEGQFPISDFTVWQLIDSAFPTGGFAHSAGLEAAWQHGEVRNRAELLSFLEASLNQLGRATLPFVAAAFDSPGDLGGLDELFDVFTTNHVANRASRLQGKAFSTAVSRVFLNDPSSAPLQHGHYAPVFGAALRRLEIGRPTAMRLFCFGHLRGMLAAAVRLNIVGPMEAQTLQHRLSSKAEEVRGHCKSLTLADLAQTAPLLDLWQGAQDRLYSRLFQS